MNRRSLLGTLLLVIGLCAGCSSGGSSGTSSSPSPETASSPTATAAPAPTVGECHQLTFAAAGQPEDDSAPVPCTGAHTSQTIKVGTLGDAGAGSDVIAQEAVKACPSRLLRRLGGDVLARRLSRFEVVSFTPTTRERDAGASWLRCDVVGLAAANSLLRLPTTVLKVLDDPTALDRFGTCGTTAPGKPGFSRVVCRRRHSWRAVDTVDLPRSAHYLGAKAAAQGDSSCKDVAAARAGGALKYTWSFEWPTQDQWASGQRYGYCWIPG